MYVDYFKIFQGVSILCHFFHSSLVQFPFQFPNISTQFSLKIFFSLIVTNLCSIYMLSTTEQRATAVITDLGQRRICPLEAQVCGKQEAQGLVRTLRRLYWSRGDCRIPQWRLTEGAAGTALEAAVAEAYCTRRVPTTSFAAAVGQSLSRLAFSRPRGLQPPGSSVRGLSGQEYWSGWPSPPPVDHVLSEHSFMIHPSWWPCTAWLMTSLSYTNPFTRSSP